MKLNSEVTFELKKLLKCFQESNTNNLCNPNNHLQKIIKTLEDMLDENQTEASFKQNLAFLQSQLESKAPNFIEAALVLGFWYKLGADKNHTPETAQKHAFELFQIAATAGNAIGQHQVGCYYIQGNVCTKDESRGNAFFQLAADQGNSEALNDLGYSYEYGRGIPKNEKRATELYQLAFLQGHSLATFNLGFCYERGHGVAKDLQNAAMLYNIAAELGLAAALNSLGSLYLIGDGISFPKDEKRAFELFQQAANKGYMYAYNNLGLCYQEGRGVTKNEKFGFECYQRSFYHGNLLTLKNMGQAYMDGRGITRDTKLAVEIFYLAEAQGILHALDELAICYHNGAGVPINMKRMVLLMQMCILHNIGDTELFNEKILEVSKDAFYPDLASAVDYYKKLAYEKNDSSALATLAFCYQLGLGTKRNLKDAIQLYLEAQGKGEECFWDLYICYETYRDSYVCSENQTNINIPDLRKQFLEFYKTLEKEAEKNPSAASVLGYLFERGHFRDVGIEQNLFMAIRYYQKSLTPEKDKEDLSKETCSKHDSTNQASSKHDYSREDSSKQHAPRNAHSIKDQGYARNKLEYYTPLHNLKTACQNALPEILYVGPILNIIAEYAFEHDLGAKP